MTVTRNEMAKMDDRRLIELWSQAHSKEALGVLLLRYAPVLYGVCLKHSGNSSDAKADASDIAVLLADDPGKADLTDKEFAQWIYDFVGEYEGKRHPRKHSHGTGNHLSKAGMEFVRGLKAGGETPLALLESKKTVISKPQRESIAMFLIGRKTVGQIAENTGYLTGDIRNYITDGIGIITGPVDPADRPEVMPLTPGTSHKLLHYIDGERHSTATYDIEYESLSNPLLSDALDGFDMGGNHGANVVELNRQIASLFFRKHKKNKVLTTAAVIIAVAAAVMCAVILYSRTKPPVAETGYSEAATESVTALTDDNPDIYNTSPQPGGNFDGTAGIPGDTGAVSSTGVKTGDGPQAGTNNGVEPQTTDGAAATSTETDTTAIRPEDNAYQVARLVSISQNDTVGADGKKHFVSVPILGRKQFDEYLAKAAHAPEDGAKGNVILTFIVNKHGHPSRIRVVNVLSQPAHREAIRLIENGPEWTATDREVTITIRFE